MRVAGWDLEGERPAAGRHFPSSAAEFAAWFPTEEACRSYVEAVRFRAGMACPRCGSTSLRRHTRRWWCRDCRRWVTLTAGTLLEHTRVPLKLWLAACWDVTSTKVGMSALSLHRTLGLSYTTAWSMLHKLRAAMDQTGRERLSGEVEVDETLVGGRDEGVGGRVRGRKQVVVIACERKTATAMGRIRLARAPDASAVALAKFIEANIEPGSLIITDAWKSYPPAIELLAENGLEYRHKAFNLSGTEEKAHELLPHVHRVAALLKRWILGTHQGSPEAPHLDAYLDEYVFRFNRRSSDSRGLLFWWLVCGLVATEPVTRQALHRRRPDQNWNDVLHANEVRNDERRRRRNEQRDRYRRKAEDEGRQVRPYKRLKPPAATDEPAF